ncbi:uncharacterized protein LOC143296378 [Babylonia areolata]|uniref:uncharacterized protein LOC143296378 n=1 Tax=Babylonia areolata TaxID=304850 RepID=UPI003FD0BB7C
MSTTWQAAQNNPEDVWMPFIKHLYPRLQDEVYRLPPLHFNSVPRSVVNIGGLTVYVRDNPSKKCGKHPQPPPAPQVAGTVFTTPPDSEPVGVQDTHFQDDAAQERCCKALLKIQGGAMIISQLVFKKYLDNKTNPERYSTHLHDAAISKLPNVKGPHLPKNIKDGECDILIIHRHYGLVLGEIKSVGSHSSVTNKAIVDKIGKAVRQLDNQEQALRYLMKDISQGIRITKSVLLPEITSDELLSALSTSPEIRQELIWCTNSKHEAEAVRKCLCRDQLTEPSTWWDTLHTSLGPDLIMTPEIYERIVARFCGLATTVDVPTACPPHRKVIRSMGEAVAETGLRFSYLTLTPDQVKLLTAQPELPWQQFEHVYLQGPPGCGKTVVLVLKGLQWAQEGKKVIILSVRPQAHAVTLLMETQIRNCLGEAAASSSIHRQRLDFSDESFDVDVAVSELLPQLRARPVLILVDEITIHLKKKFMDWLGRIRRLRPDTCVWAAGMWRFDYHGDSVPSWLKIQELREALRFPSNIMREVEFTNLITEKNIVPPFSASQFPGHTDGPEVMNLSHAGLWEHDGDHPLECEKCADDVASFINQELRVGQSDQPLKYKDVWILFDRTGEFQNHSEVLIQRLNVHKLPVKEVTYPLSVDDEKDLAEARTDRIVATDWRAVQGMERMVIIGLGLGGGRLHIMSRCTSFLLYIK